MKIGFIGLGIMGKPMVRNLLKAGHEVIVYDVVESNMDQVVKDGAKAVSYTHLLHILKNWQRTLAA